MIQSVDRAIRILKALAAGPGRLGVSELSERLGLAKGTVHGLLRTLHEHGLVEQHADSDKYQLGPQLLQLSTRYLDLSELRARSLAWSELLATRADEAVRVGVAHGDGVLVVHHVFRPDASLQILEVGSVLPLHATALGKAVLAHLDDDVRDDVGSDDPRDLESGAVGSCRLCPGYANGARAPGRWGVPMSAFVTGNITPQASVGPDLSASPETRQFCHANP